MITIANIVIDLHLRADVTKEDVYQRIIKILRKEFDFEIEYRNSDVSASIESYEQVKDD